MGATAGACVTAIPLMNQLVQGYIRFFVGREIGICPDTLLVPNAAALYGKQPTYCILSLSLEAMGSIFSYR